jgi:hypothetical protein
MVTDPAESTEAAAGAVTADGASVCFWATFFAFDFDAAGFFALVDVPLGEGEAVADVEGVAVGWRFPTDRPRSSETGSCSGSGLVTPTGRAGR